MPAWCRPLTQLTRLCLNYVPVSSDMQLLLPVQLKQLDVRYRQELLSPGESNLDPQFDAVASLQHFTCLTELSISAEELIAGSSIPPNLRSLELTAIIPRGALAGLSSLHQATSIAHDSLSCMMSMHDHNAISPEDLRLIEQLQQLKQLSLSLRGGYDRLVETAAAWRNLLLCILEFDLGELTINDLQNASEDLAVCEYSTSHPCRVCRGWTWLLQNLEALLRKTCSILVNRGQSHQSGLVRIGPWSLRCAATTLCLLASHLTKLRCLVVDSHCQWFSKPSESRVCRLPALPAVGKLTHLSNYGFQNCLQQMLRGGCGWV